MFGTELERAQWDASAKLWRLTLSSAGGSGAGGDGAGGSGAGGDGSGGSGAGAGSAAAARGAGAVRELTARVLVSGAGPLVEPNWPDIPGLESFAGPRFHSARWRHDVDLTGKRVAVIGTGASAIQFVPEVQKVAGQITVFQRSAPWVMAKAEHPTSARRRERFAASPAAQRRSRELQYLQAEANFLGFKFAAVGAAAQQQALSHLRKQVADPALRAKLTPDYRMGCKRVLLSNGWYPALAASNADVVTDAIVRIEGPGGVGAQGPASVGSTGTSGGPRGAAGAGGVIVTADGTRREFDVLIAGTGFHTTDPPIAKKLFDANGDSLAEAWSDHASALRGTTVAGFPNLYLLIGPNTVLAHNSMVAIIEAQLGYVLQALDAAPRGVLDTLPAAQAAYTDRVQRDFDHSVWTTGGCSSYYIDANGRNTVIWPHSVGAFRRTLARFRPEEYVAS
jgi:cation diffusion facilitator CzcD-associated flavoprotein CzcO